MEIYGIRIYRYDESDEPTIPVYEIEKGSQLTQAEIDEARFYMKSLLEKPRFFIQILVKWYDEMSWRKILRF